MIKSGFSSTSPVHRLSSFHSRCTLLPFYFSFTHCCVFRPFRSIILEESSQQVCQPIVPLDSEFGAGIFLFIHSTPCREPFPKNIGSAGHIFQTIFFQLSLQSGHPPSIMQRLNSLARSLGGSNKAAEPEGKKRKKASIHPTTLVFDVPSGGSPVYGK